MGPETLRARAAQMRSTPGTLEAQVKGCDGNLDEAKEDAFGTVEERNGRLHCELRGENVSLALEDLESQIDDWEPEPAPSLLFLAASEGHAPLVEALVKRGANLSRQNDDGDTPLHLAAWHGNSRVIRILCAAGAQVNAGNCHDATPLHTAACAGSKEAVVTLLECGAARSSQDYLALTPMAHAEALGHDSLIPLLQPQ